MVQRLAPILIVLVVACGDATAPEQVDTPADIVFSSPALLGHVDVLAADSMCGRATGTVYEGEAARYIRDAFVRYGLAPGVPGYLQAFPVGAPPLPVAPPGTSVGEAGLACVDTAVTASQNVLGVLPGAGPLADEWVVLGAHYDAVGWRMVGQQVVVINGADDNASGTAVLLEVARLLSRWVDAHPALATNRRSLLFAAFGAEEIGLVGSSRYVENPTVPLDSIQAVVNLDMVGRLRDNLLTVQGTATSQAWSSLLAAANDDQLALGFSDDALGRSDQYPFILAGIPAVHLFTGLTSEYHTPADDTGLLNRDGMARIGEFALALLWDLATQPGQFQGIGGVAAVGLGR